jgi:hypothetical protein
MENRLGYDHFQAGSLHVGVYVILSPEPMSNKAIGRPRKLKKDQRTERITVPLNKGELGQINSAVEASGIPAATFCRLALLKATEPKGKR